MKYRLLLRKGAENDLADAYRWYTEKVPGLGNRFLAAVEQTLDSIQLNPAGYPIIYQTVRRSIAAQISPMEFSIYGNTRAFQCWR